MSRSNPVSHRIMELYDQWDRGCDYAISGETLARTLPGKIKPETVRPGKLPGFLLKDEPFTASELEVFVNDFKATFCVAGQYEFTLVDGPDIAALYDGDEHQYIDDVHTSSGLEGSCMNGKHDFLGLYYENGKKVQGLKVIYSKTGLIAARALLWHTDQGIIVLDRIYACRPVLTELVCKYARSEGWYHKAEQNFELNSRFVSEGLVDSVMYLSVSGVNEPLNDAWPYMDTFCYYEDGKLSNQSPTDEHSFRTLRRDNWMYRYTHGCVFVDTMHGRVPQ